jgi:hypothetical protein
MFICPVCGYDRLEEPPRSEEGGGSYEICESCGFQFGVSDDDRGRSYQEWRKQWLQVGAPWSSANPPPPGWNPREQLKRSGITADHPA